MQNDYENIEDNNSIDLYFNEVFQKKLLSYITNLSVIEYAEKILPNIKNSIDLLSHVDDATQPQDIRTLKIQNFEDIPKKQMTLPVFKRLVENTPALMPLALILLKINRNLTQLKERYFFVDSITININKEALLNEIWEKNLPLNGCFFNIIENDILPLIDKCLYMFPNIQRKYSNFTTLYNAIVTALHKPILRLEDRLFLDINSLLDIYLFSDDESAQFVDFCGPHYSESIEEKLDYIMQLNVLKPQKNLKARREAKIYFEAHSDYDICKKWFNKIKYLMKYINEDTCIKYILQDINSLPLDEIGINDYKHAISKIYCCENKSFNNENCEHKDKIRCKISACKKQRSIFTYIFRENEELYQHLTSKYKIKNDIDLNKLISKMSIKEFAMSFLQWKYDLLENKSIKTIANIFADSDALIKNYNAYMNDTKTELLERNWELDDKEYCPTYSYEDKIIEKLEQLYQKFEHFSLNLSDKKYDQIYGLIREIERYLNKTKNPDKKNKQRI